MTELEFKKSLTKEQKKFYEAAIQEALKREDQYFREAQAARMEIMLILHALNFEPIQSLPALSDAVRKTVKRIREEAPIKPSERQEMEQKIQFMKTRLEDQAGELRRLEDELKRR